MTSKMKKLGVLVLAAALFCGISGYANAKGEKGSGPRYMEQLSPEQQTQARGIFEESKLAGKGLREEIAAKRAELAYAVKNANPDNARIEALSKELGQLRGKEMLIRMDTAQKLKAAGLPEMTKPAKGDRKADARKISKEEFANKRISRLPEAKQAEARSLFDEFQGATAQTRESLNAKNADLEKAMSAGDAGEVEKLCTEIGELRGKMLVAKAELRQKLVKADIPADTFDRDGAGKSGRPGKDGKRGKDGRHGKDGKRDQKMD